METRAGVLMGSGASGATETDSRGPALPGIGDSGAKDTERRGAALPAVAMRTRADIKEAVPLAPGAAAAPSCSAGGGAAASACKAVLSLLAAAAAAMSLFGDAGSMAQQTEVGGVGGDVVICS